MGVTVNLTLANDSITPAQAVLGVLGPNPHGNKRRAVAGLAVASEERIEACLLHVNGGEILSLRSFVEDGGARLNHLISRLRARGMGTLRFPKVHPAEIPKELLETLGFRPAGAHRLYAAAARSN